MNNCYTCKFKGTVPGSAHSSCGALSHIIENKEEAKAMEFLISLGMKTLTKEDGSPAVELDPHGVRNGWASWPIDFDPTWVSSCAFYTDKNTDNESR